MRRRFHEVLGPLLASALTNAVVASEPGGIAGPGADETLRFPAEFFAPYRPVTALEMVEQVPGFRIDDGSDRRGFGGAAGNVLIDGERPSSKQDSVSEILARIPAARVIAVELVRADTGRQEGSAQAQLANVVLDADQRSWIWESSIEQNLDRGPPTPGASLSMVDRLGATRWGAGVEVRTRFEGNVGIERLLVGGDTRERRTETERAEEASIRINANSETRLVDVVVRLNAEVQYAEADASERSLRTAAASDQDPPRVDLTSDDAELEFEIGGDLEWSPVERWGVKLVGLHRAENEEESERELLRRAGAEADLRQVAQGESTLTESIVRLELERSSTETLTELDVEVAFNELDNVLALEVDQAGSLVPVEVPDANNRVSELRGEARLRDTREFDAITVECEIGAEFSRLRQRGGDERDFVFFKPSVTVVRAPRADTIDRIRIAREVAQLDFDDFVSSTDFDDGDIDRGNPALEPERSWRFEASAERRFGDIGTLELGGFHDWVEKVQDLLPIDGRFEVPGNIGDGRRWGLTLEGTLPLAWLGIESGRLDFDALWQDSRVTDPVTGQDRRFSEQRRYAVAGRFRQDFPATGWAWGLSGEFDARSTRFELEELDIENEGTDLQAFIETTRFFGVKLRLAGRNLLDRDFTRDRVVFLESRADGDPVFRELRLRRQGRSLLLTVSGEF